jgi:hypothetical protein
MKSGYGFGIRLGNQIHVPLLAVTPELVFTYHGFTGDYGPTLYRAIAGLRLAVGEVVRPGVLAHAGCGARKVEFAGQADTSSSFTYGWTRLLVHRSHASICARRSPPIRNAFQASGRKIW